jgi:hypothetical protein
MEIYFNSKSKDYYELSNFYGGVECEFMKDRFLDKEIKSLFDKFETCNKDEFISYLKELQPEKKDWTQAKINYWFKDGKPIRGILSKLAGASVKDTPTGRRRLKILKKMANFEGEVRIKHILTLEEKKELMLKCLKKKFLSDNKNKYNENKYNKLLLSTGELILHEKPMRGKGDDWTYPGGDLLGKLLMNIRKKIN